MSPVASEPPNQRPWRRGSWISLAPMFPRHRPLTDSSRRPRLGLLCGHDVVAFLAKVPSALSPDQLSLSPSFFLLFPRLRQGLSRTVGVLSCLAFATLCSSLLAQTPWSSSDARVSAPSLFVQEAERDGIPGVRAAFDVEAGADATLALLWDVARFRSIFPDIKELAVLARPNERTVEVRFSVDAVVASPTYTLRRTLESQARRVAWVSIGGDLKRIVGSWSVVPVTAQRCRVTYESFVDVGVFGVTTAYRSLVMGRVEQMVDRVRAAARGLSSGSTADDLRVRSR
jgi:ribosome-associated toxin RatA of RatAB toxin-antitoxin module